MVIETTKYGTHMTTRLLVALALGAIFLSAPARGEDLMQIYREAVTNDPVLASAQANWQSSQENLPQARAGLLPSANATAGATENQYDATIKTDPNTKCSPASR